MAEKEKKEEKPLRGRGRVKALLIEPLASDGMRFKAGTPDKTARARIDAIADDLAYMSDAGLAAMRDWMARHGEGSARCFWPSRISINSTAEAFEKRPVEEMPALIRWFASNAGRTANDADRLVAEYEFFRTRKRPPINDQDRNKVREVSERWTRRVDLARDRTRRGYSLSDDDAGWLRWYEGRLEYVTGLVAAERAA